MEQPTTKIKLLQRIPNHQDLWECLVYKDGSKGAEEGLIESDGKNHKMETLDTSEKAFFLPLYYFLGGDGVSNAYWTEGISITPDGTSEE